MDNTKYNDGDMAEKLRGKVVVGTSEEPSNQENSVRPWSDGLAKRLPVIGFLCLALVLGIMATLLVILKISHEKRIDTWCTTYYNFRGEKKKFQLTVSVWISGLSLAANKLIGLIFAEAVTIAWWVSAIEGRTLRELHDDWESGKSVFSALTSIFRRRPYLSKTVVASIACAFFSVHGILFQRGSTTHTSTIRIPTKVTAKLAEQLPPGWSGQGLSLSGNIIDDISGPLQQIMQEYSNGVPIEMQVEGCEDKLSNEAICTAVLPGVGFSYDCIVDTVLVNAKDYPTNRDNLTKEEQDELDESVRTLSFPRWDKVVFDIHFDADFEIYGQGNPQPRWTLDLTVMHKPSSDCLTDLTRRRCKMTPSIVKYPVQISEGIATLRDPSVVVKKGGSTWRIDPVEKVLEHPEGGSKAIDWDYFTVNGIQVALKNFIAAKYSIGALANYDRVTKEIQYEEGGMGPNFSGSLALVFQNITAPRSTQGCEVSVAFRDPLQHVLDVVREVMFRSSVAIAAEDIKAGDPYLDQNKSYWRKVEDPNGKLIVTTAIYDTNFGFVIAGALLMILCVILIAPTFWGFWLLGRKMSLSPLEVGKALRGPAPRAEGDVPQTSVLDKVVEQNKDGTNAPSTELVDLLGDIKVKYGEVAPQKLGFAVEDEVVKPRTGRAYY